jgi:DNA repair protein RecN (Recombination protein N)
MLCELRIQNFAIIDRLEIQFGEGFNVITGETGAGKSIIIDAVDLLLGGRGDADFIRAGSDKAVVEGVFRVPPALVKETKAMLDEQGVELDHPDEIILTRELRATGRNVCRINGSSVHTQFFRDLGEKLVDIHGQSEHLSLLRSR